MKFGKNRRKGGEDAFDQKQQARKKILEDPSIIEELFHDQHWKAFDETAMEHEIPSARMQAAIEKEIHETRAKEAYRQSKRLKIRRFTIYAAAASVLLLMTFNLWRWNHQQQPVVQSANIEREEISLADSAWIVLANDEGRDSAIVLPDQSEVKLSANSSIRYRSNFTAKSREVYLEGKAYFAVAKDPSRPFSVYANETKTTALGTSFTINTRSNSTETAIELHSGKVLVASTSSTPAFENVFLDNIGEQLLFDANTRLVAHSGKKEIKAAPTKKRTVIAHLGSRLQLENIPLNDVFAALEKAYHISIKINDRSIEKIHYTGTIDPEKENVQDVLAIICLINDLRYEINSDGHYNLYKQE